MLGRVEDCDLDNLLVKLRGKGSKERLVPFSFELRKVLARYVSDFKLQPHMLVLSTKASCKLDRHVISRNVKLLCARLGFDAPARTVSRRNSICTDSSAVHSSIN